MIAACLSFSVGFAIIKHLTYELSEPVIGFWRSLFAVLCFLPMIARRGIRFLKTTQPWGHVWRGAVGYASLICFIYGLHRLPLGDAVALSFTLPLWSLVLGVLVLGDRVTPRLVLAVLTGFGGVLLVAQPSGDGIFGLGAIVTLISAVLGCFALLTVKRLLEKDDPYNVAFHFMFMSMLLGFVLVLFDWQTPALHQWPALAGTGVMFFVAQNFLARAYYYGSFTRVAPLDFVRLPASIAIGYFWFGDVPTLIGVVGMALILLTALDTLLTSRKKSA